MTSLTCRTRRYSLTIAAVAACVSLVAACSSTSGGAPASTAAAGTPAGAGSSSAAPAASSAPAAGGVSASAVPAATSGSAAAGGSGAPALNGATIRLAIGAAPQTSDTKIELMAQILDSWGAKASIVNQTGDPAAVRAILAGSADVGLIAVSTAINSGLMIFGPAQPRVAYDFMGAPSLSNISQLPGHVYGTSNTHGLEALMFADLMAKNHVDVSKVHVTLAGGASVRAAAMLEHHIDATFIPSDQVQPLIKAGFHVLAVMSTAAPELSDSFTGATPGWVSKNPKLAVAVDEAWIKAAQVFNNDQAQWVAAAVKYAGGTTADAQSSYTVLKAADTFPDTKAAFSTASGVQQEALAFKVGAINSDPSQDKWITDTYWDQACTALNIT